MFDTNSVVSTALFVYSAPTRAGSTVSFLPNLCRITAAVAVAIALIGCTGGRDPGSNRADASDPDMVARGEVVYQEACASCHGVNLEGQANWTMRNSDGTLPAPPHDATGHTWHHGDQLLFELTKWGPSVVIGNDYNSAMPGFSDTLNDDDIWAVLAYIKSRWPDEIRAAQSAR